MQPHILIDHLDAFFNLPHQLCLLIFNFLTERKQWALVNGAMSNVLIFNTGSPQECVLSPLLFIIYTDSRRSAREDSYLVKFSDDTALLSLLEGPGSSNSSTLSAFVSWCDNNGLDLNVSKTKELIVNFSKNQSKHAINLIHGMEVEIVESYKYLGTVFDSQLKFDINTEVIAKKGQQRINLLRKLNSFNLSRRIQCLFYKSFIESLLTFSFIYWFHGLCVKDKNC